MVAGIDVGARIVHVVTLHPAVHSYVFPAADLDGAARAVAGAEVIAIDAPAQPSAQPHAREEALSPKFRRARCCEIALGREHGIWVPWVAPPERPADPWMEVGFELFDALGKRAVEVYPHAAFRMLAGGARLPRKTTAEGRAARIDLLQAAGVDPPDRSHDSLDAAVAALTARHVADGTALRVTCGHDDSAIWLIAPQRRRG